MCGIVGAVTRRAVSGILLEGLQRLEYRGYDSAGLAVTTPALWLTGIKKPALRPFLLERLDRHTPTRLVPCHGDVLDTPDVAGQIREVVERSL